MNYEGHIIRPPSEADSIILQVTVGCSHNKCTFCGTYKDVRFRIKEQHIIDEDLAFAARYCLRQKRLFLADGDVLSLSQKRLTDLLDKIHTRLPWVNRISLYANARSILNKTSAQLLELKQRGLDRVYMGLESGHEPTLEAIRKGADASSMIKAAEKITASGLFLSVTALLGIAGTVCSQAHAEATGKVLTRMAPSQIAVLTLMLLPNTPLYELEREGGFQLPDRKGLLRELYTMVQHIDLKRTLFQTNHASNYLPINCRLARDKDHILDTVNQALSGTVGLVPERMRAL